MLIQRENKAVNPHFGWEEVTGDPSPPRPLSMEDDLVILAHPHDSVISHLASGNYWYKSLCTGWKYITIDAWRCIFLPSQMVWEGPCWLGCLLAQHKPQPWDTLAMKDPHCCDSFGVSLRFYFCCCCSSAHGSFGIQCFFLNPCKGAAFSWWAAQSLHLQPEKAGLKHFLRAVESDVPRELGLDFLGA